MFNAEAPAATPHLADVLQFAALNRTSLFVALQGPAGSGYIAVDSGDVVGAQYAGLIDEAACYALINLTQPTYTLRSFSESQRGKQRFAVTYLLLEAARRSDEGLHTHADISARQLQGLIAAPIPRESPDSSMVAATSVALPLKRPSQRWLWLGAAAAVFCFTAATLLIMKIRAPQSATGVRETLAAVAKRAANFFGATERAATEMTHSAAKAKIYEAAELEPGDQRPTPLRPLRLPRPSVNLALNPTLILRVTLSKDGQVTDAQLLHARSELQAFQRAALDAVRNMRFSPAQHAGLPVAVRVNLPITFEDAGSTTTLRIKGSDTMGHSLMPALARSFGDRVSVESLGSSSAFTGLIDGSADVGASSRPINEKELQDAELLGVRLREFVIGYDGIAVIVHPSNPLTNINLQTLGSVFSGEFVTWQPVSGLASAIHLMGRPAYSGTHAFFRDFVLRQSRGAGHETADYASTLTSFEDSASVVNHVANDPDAIGYVGLGALSEKVRPLAVSRAAGDEATFPDVEAVRSGRYPIARPLMLYSRAPMEPKVQDFLRLALSAEGQRLVEKHGFVASGFQSPTFQENASSAGPAPRVSRILFAHHSDKLTNLAGEQLDALANSVKTTGERLLVVGHADAMGSSDGNHLYASLRAVRVLKALKTLGVPASRITLETAGAAQPLTSNSTSEGRDNNRRVDIFVVPAQK